MAKVESEMLCRCCSVTGHVQGVSFRAYTRTEAKRLGLRGHARNLPDGSVEVLACGEPQAVEALCRWLWCGSPASRVETVQVEDEIGVDVPPGFSIG